MFGASAVTDEQFENGEVQPVSPDWYVCYTDGNVIMVAHSHGQAIIFYSCGFFFFLFSSPVLNSRRVDVYHNSTHDVALVQI